MRVAVLSNWSFCLFLSAKTFSSRPASRCSASCLFAHHGPTAPAIWFHIKHYLLLSQMCKWVSRFVSSCNRNLPAHLFCLNLDLFQIHFLAPNLSSLRNVCTGGVELLDRRVGGSSTSLIISLELHCHPL